MVSAQDTTTSRDVEIEVTLGTPDGTSLYHNRSAALLNEQSPLTIPDGLAPGLYRMDLVLYSSGQVVQKKTVSIFVDPNTWRITGIRSFPPVITSAATVMLKAELDIPANANPYLRWSWKGKVIQKGMLSAGLGEILWDVPGEGGVYTVTLELFPAAPPQGSDFSFASSVALSTDIIVSGSAAQTAGKLGPASSFLTLLRLQGSLADSGAGAKKVGRTRAAAIGSPAVVSLENGFGYQLDGSSGISVPWLALPVTAGALGPFTISIGVSFDDLASANQVVSASSSDGSFSLVMAINPRTSVPEARITSSGSPTVVVPWGGPPLSPRQRSLLSLSITPSASGLIAQWYLDGTQESRTALSRPVGPVSPDGSISIGGSQGFHGVVDEFGVYAWDAAGRPSTDPDLYLRAQSGLYGNRLVFASGFDGQALQGTFTTEGTARLNGGLLDLSPGGRLVLPPLQSGEGVDLTVELSASSGRNASLLAQWQGASQPAAAIPVVVTGTEIRCQLSADGLSLIVPSADGDHTVRIPPAGTTGTDLILKIADPADARSDLLVDSVLAVKTKR